MAGKRWSELSKAQQRVVLAAGSAELVMTIAAWVDLARRPASGVRGSKGAWALGVLIQPVGPIAYFTLGRR